MPQDRELPVRVATDEVISEGPERQTQETEGAGGDEGCLLLGASREADEPRPAAQEAAE